jgi:heme exporter protein C
MTKRDVGYHALIALTALGLVAAPVAIFAFTPVVPSMGLSQKIFYYHVPCAWLMLLSAVLAGAGGAALLLGGRVWGDRLVAAGAETTVVFGALVLTTGPLWARKAWGHYWVWDARLTTLLILFLTFLAALAARRYAGAAGRRVAAGAALLGAVNAPLVYAAVRIWKTTHPPATVAGALSPALQPAFWISVATFSCFFALLFALRLRLARTEDEVDALTVAIAERAMRRGPRAPARAAEEIR